MSSTVLMSNGGANTFRSSSPCDRLIVGTVDGIFVLSGGRTGVGANAAGARQAFRLVR